MRPGYQEGSESMWWWKVAQHLDETQLALSNAMAHNVDDPRPVQALYGRLREGQAILLEIFRMKGLLPAAPPNGRAEMPGPGIPVPGMSGPGIPMPPGAPMPEVATPDGPGSAAEEPAVAEADHRVAASAPEQPVVVVIPPLDPPVSEASPIIVDPAATAPDIAPPAGPSAGRVGG